MKSIIAKCKVSFNALLLLWHAGETSFSIKTLPTLNGTKNFKDPTPAQREAHAVSETTAASFSDTTTSGSLLSKLDRREVLIINPTCKNISHLAYQGNWCGASDPENYLKTNMAMFTCSGRCGKKPPYGNLRSECACDERCYIHEDCCPDMVTVCPATYEAGMRKYARLGQASESCENYGFFLHSSCEPASNGVPGATSGVNSAELNEETSRVVFTDPLFSPRWLGKIFQKIKPIPRGRFVSQSCFRQL
ncbi:hypothetical protein RRG08_004052 [Elysia crispata]|uniref:SMB domain-containing protein n=1 Tax=Elysia crispata TaxID=231223 RepID=A0AAE1CPX0_9GAST|nr:hypothetical protein RRG08_004052 [Elysia crispata]